MVDKKKDGDSAKNKLSELAGMLPEGPGWVWVLAAAFVVLIMTLGSVKNIEPGQVAIKVNNLSGAQEAITKPGWTIRLPLLHSVHILDGKPQTFSMKGDESRSALEVRELTVRASDGSNFHFSDTTIIFQLNGSDAVASVNAAGLEDGYMSWMKPYARSILRDEFGRESTIHVSDPTTYGTAANRAKDRLNQELGPMGIQIMQLVTPRPRFNEAYEHAIEERNALSNQLEVIKSNLDRAETDRGRRLAEVDQQQNKIVQEGRAALEHELARAVAAQAEKKQEADTYAIAQVAEGQAALSAAKFKAQELEGELDARYVSKQAEVMAFRNQPVERVMAVLGEKLRGVTIRVQPWADDATPSRVRYEDLRK
jgi:membrane protease subunit HflC